MFDEGVGISIKLSLLNEAPVYFIVDAFIFGAVIESVAEIVLVLIFVEPIPSMLAVAAVILFVTARLLVEMFPLLLMLPVVVVVIFPVVIFALAAFKLVELRVAIVAVVDVKVFIVAFAKDMLVLFTFICPDIATSVSDVVVTAATVS